MLPRERERQDWRTPPTLWVFGALVATVAGVVGLGRATACGLHLSGPRCWQLFGPTLPRVIWLAYLALGAASVLIALGAARSSRWKSASLAGEGGKWLFGAAIVFALGAIVALGAYYVFAIVVIHWLLLRAIERRYDGRSSLLELSVILISWVVAAPISWAEPLGTWILAAWQTPAGPFAGIVFAAVLVLNTAALRGPPQGRAPRISRSGVVLDVLALALFGFISFRQDFFANSTSFHHWGFYVGAAELVRQGGWLLWDVPSQYGFLSILTIVVTPFSSAWTAMYVLDATMIFFSACIVFAVLRSLRLGQFSVPFSLLTTLTAVYLLPGDYAVLSGPQFYPSIGAFRFFWVDVLLFVVFFAYVKQRSNGPSTWAILGGSVAWMLGVLWSAESAIYVTVIWIPSLVALTLREGSGTIAARAQALGRRANVLLVCTPPALLAVAVLVIHLSYSIALGHGPDYFGYVDFGMSYANGFGAYPVNGFGTGWLLVFALATAITAWILVVKRSRGAWRALPLLYAAGAAIWVTGSYFASRSADSNVTNLSTTLVLGVAMVLVALEREGVLHSGERYVRIALVAPLTVAAAITVGNQYWLSALAREVSSGYTLNVPGLLPQLPPSVIALFDRAHVTPSDPIVYNGLTVLPERPGAVSDTVPATFWLPANPSIALTVVPAPRRLVYFERFTTRRPKEGWYLRAHADADTCEAFDPQYRDSRTYRTPEWDLSWCSLAR